MVIFLMINAGGSGAQEFPEKWQIKSLYKDPLTGRLLSPITWAYETEKKNTDIKVSVTDLNNRVEYRSELIFNKDDRLYKINIYTKIGGKEKLIPYSFDPDDPVFFDGTLVPSNWLNSSLPWNGKNQKYKIIKKVGSTSFAENYIVKGKIIGIKDAVDLGLVSGKILNLDIISSELLFLTVERLNDNGPDEAVVTQLWSKKLFFWLYEKTPFRESWYLSD